MFIKYIIVFFILLFTSCNSSKDVNNSMTKNEVNPQKDNQMIKQGFRIGEVKHLKESLCEFIIIDLNSKANLDPINFNDTIYNSIRNNGQKVYFKYRPLRRMNRCPEGNPISLIDIKKRED